jgi:hypothetical protein
MHFRLPKPLHGWREFAGEVGIIVIGVLIALSAEQIVQTLQWHEKVRHAEQAMRLELAEDDGPQAYGRLLIALCLDKQLARIHDRPGAAASPDQLRAWVHSYAPPFRTWDSEAWKTVLASDVGSYMGPEKLVEWSAAYRTLPSLTEWNARETDLAAELRDAVPPAGAPSPADLQNLRRIAGQLRVLNDRISRGSQLFLARTQRLGAGVSALNRRSLQMNAKAIYGGCALAPNLGATPAAQTSTANLRGFVH